MALPTACIKETENGLERTEVLEKEEVVGNGKFLDKEAVSHVCS